MSNRVQKKSQNQLIEHMIRLDRVQSLTNEHELYTLQYNRIKKQLQKLKVKNEKDEVVWDKNLRTEDGYEVVLFHHPKYRRVVLTRDKLRSVENRLKHDKQFLTHLASKIKLNRY